ncbi:MAG: MFS transporter [Acholeplasmataceae bacterium]|nr:MAG: MFS transporter [Acholeplasmataceae bacterium]
MNVNERSIRGKLGYGIADIYGGGAFLIISILFLVFMTDIVGMNPFWAGSIPLIGRIWDAVTDPLMGAIVDKTRSRFGSKRLYLLVGSFVAAVTFALLWFSFNGSAGAQYVFYLAAFILFSTGFTIVMVPYNALLPDMVSDYHLRGQYTGFRMIFSALSAILAGLLPDIIIRGAGGGGQGFMIMGIVFGLIFFVSLLLCFLNTWELEKTDKQVERHGIRYAVSVFKNRSFRIYLGIFLFAQGSADFMMALVIYFLAVVLRQSDQYVFVMSGVLSAQLIAMVLYQFLLKKHAKTLPVMIGFPLQIAASLAMLFFAYAGAPILPIVFLSFLAGFGTAGGTVTSFAILADMADVDELITSERRAGTYSGMATFTRKIANGMALGLVGALLFLIGYDGSLAVQSATAVMGIRLMFVLLPILFLLLTFVFIRIYPVTQDAFKVLSAQIEARRKQEPIEATAAEIALCEQMTGYAYDQLWKKDNASL